MPDQREHEEEDSAKRPFNPQGDDEHVHDDQQPITGAASRSADDVAEDDPYKVERLTKAGRDTDLNVGAEWPRCRKQNAMTDR